MMETQQELQKKVSEVNADYCIYFGGEYLTYVQVVIKLLRLQEIEDIVNNKI